MGNGSDTLGAGSPAGGLPALSFTTEDRMVLGQTGIHLAAQNLAAAGCKQCGRRLLSGGCAEVTGPDSRGWVGIAVYHQDCLPRPGGPSPTRPAAWQIGVYELGRESAWLAEAGSIPGNDAAPAVIVINPCCDYAILRPSGKGRWRTATLSMYDSTAFAPAGSSSLPVSHLWSALRAGRLSVTFDAETHDQTRPWSERIWSAPVAGETRDQVIAHSGVTVILAAHVVPGELGAERLRACAGAPDILSSWAALDRG